MQASILRPSATAGTHLSIVLTINMMRQQTFLQPVNRFATEYALCAGLSPSTVPQIVPVPQIWLGSYLRLSSPSTTAIAAVYNSRPNSFTPSSRKVEVLQASALLQRAASYTAGLYVL